MNSSYRPICGVAAVLLLITTVGCDTSPRTLDEIEAEQKALPKLYITAETGKHIQRPGDGMVFRDSETGELAWPAYECQNPDCPGRAHDGSPQLFIHRDVLLNIDESGELAWEEIPAGVEPKKYIQEKGGQLAPTCPACLKHRDLASESNEARQQYMEWAVPHVLPETAARKKELEEEYQARRKKVKGG